MMDKYTKWCDKEENEKTDAIRTNKRTIGDLEAEISDASARVAELSTEVEEVAGKISSAEADLANATSIREEEHSTFAATEAELVETIDSTERAISVVSRGQVSFLQSHGEDMKKVTAALQKIIESTWVNKHDKAAVQALLQSQDGDEDLSLQPQASTAAYSSQGGGILDTIKDMKEKAESTLSDARTEEMKSAHAYEMMKSSIEQELGTMQKRMSEATSEKSGLEESKATSEKS